MATSTAAARMEVINGTPFRYGSPSMCQCKTPTTRKIAINPKMMAPTIPNGVRRRASNSPTTPTIAATISQISRFPKVITISIDLLYIVQDFHIKPNGHLIHLHVIMSLEGYKGLDKYILKLYRLRKSQVKREAS
jgi:hypothetical protein